MLLTVKGYECQLNKRTARTHEGMTYLCGTQVFNRPNTIACKAAETVTLRSRCEGPARAGALLHSELKLLGMSRYEDRTSEIQVIQFDAVHILRAAQDEFRSESSLKPRAQSSGCSRRQVHRDWRGQIAAQAVA
jgi:hypothetical protein